MHREAGRRRRMERTRAAGALAGNRAENLRIGYLAAEALLLSKSPTWP